MRMSGPGRRRVRSWWQRWVTARSHRAHLVAAVMVGAWVVLVGSTLHCSFQLSRVEQDRYADLLPAGAPATEALALEQRIVGRSTNEALVVLRIVPSSPTALGQAMTSLAARVRAARLPGVLSVGPPVVAADGRVGALPVTTTGSEAGVAAAVRGLRRVATDHLPAGATTGVTGPAAFQSDLLGAADALGGRLLVATVVLVAVLLVIVYRSPLLWLLPLVSVAGAAVLANALVDAVAHVTAVTSESAGLVTVLVFGAGTDYALLLTARYRERLLQVPDHRRALGSAWKASAPPILASAATVAGGLCCLLLARDGVIHSFGAVGALGIFAAAVGVTTLYPALLVLVGRRVFWPAAAGRSPARQHRPGEWWRQRWHRLRHAPTAAPHRRAMRGARPVWVGSLVVLAVGSAGLTRLDTAVTTVGDLAAQAPSVQGMRLLGHSLPGGLAAPAFVVLRSAALVPRARQVVSADRAVAALGPTERRGDLASFAVVLRGAPVGRRALDAVTALQQRLAARFGRGALVGGQTAEDVAVGRTSTRDLLVVGPAVLVLALVVLGVLLGAVLGPLVVVGLLVVSFAAVLGVCGAVLGRLLGLHAIDPSVPVLSFVFLVALGIDYTVFLLARMREELRRAPAVPRRAIERARNATAAVLTAAGLVLAGTFSVLIVLPLLPVEEIGLVVAVGVLVDALFVRSVVVPALAADLGRWFWWPGPLSRTVPAGHPTTMGGHTGRALGTPAEPDVRQPGGAGR